MHTTYVENITAFISNMRPSKQEESKPVGPVPVITIDGVDYYHKCEFDLEAILQLPPEPTTYYNLLTGEQIDSTNDTNYMCHSSFGNVGNVVYFTSGYGMPGHNWILAGTPVPIDYTSRAFICVDTKEEADTNAKLCLPTCSAYYGFLSEDGKTFISYYNLKGE